MELNEIVNKISELSKRHLSEKDKSIFQCILKDKNEMLLIISAMKHYLSKITCLTDNMKIFHMLGFLPRFGDNIYVCSCFLYWYIKSINSSIKMFVLPDGSIRGFVPSKNITNKEHIILQAHMDVVPSGRNEETIHYGVYGSNPNIQFYHNDKDNGLWINKNNSNTVLGADDGKGVAEIINLLIGINNRTFDKNIDWPNISFLLTAVEEAPFGKSILEFCKNEINIKKLFPQWFNNILYINLDSYSGTQIDTHGNLSIKAKELESKIIAEYRNFVEKNLKIKSTQELAWHNPPSEVLFLHNHTSQLTQCKDLCYVSMNADSINPHSNEENIDLLKFDKFCKWFNKKIIYKTKK